MNPRRLYRCRHDRPLTGVSAGIAEYLDLDPTVIRVLWVLATLLSGGLAILLYVILVFVMPLEPLPAARPAAGPGYAPPADAAGAASGDPDDEATATWTAPSGSAPASAWGAPGEHAAWAARVHEHAPRPRGNGRLGFATGVVLVIFGAIALFGPLFPGWIGGAALGPAFLLALGVALVIVAARRPTGQP